MNQGNFSYAKIRSFGDKNSAVTHDGDTVTRQEYIYDPDYGLVECIPYELHFIYQDPRSFGPKAIKGRWGYMCTCGSPAGIISYKDMSNLITIESKGFVLACLAHTASKKNTGVGNHADGSHE